MSIIHNSEESKVEFNFSLFKDLLSDISIEDAQSLFIQSYNKTSVTLSVQNAVQEVQSLKKVYVARIGQ